MNIHLFYGEEILTNIIIDFFTNSTLESADAHYFGVHIHYFRSAQPFTVKQWAFH